MVAEPAGEPAGTELLAKTGTTGAGMTGAAVVATSAGEEAATGELAAAVVATSAGLVTTGAAAAELTLTTGAAVGATAGALVTGLVTVQGQLVIVRVVAWKRKRVSKDYQIDRESQAQIV